MKLRDYQVGCLDKSLERYQQGVNRQLAVMATGLGKAVLFAALRQHHGFHKRVMVLVHREELAAQAAARIHRWNPGLMVGVEMASSQSAPMDNFVVASVPTLGRSGSKRITKFHPSEFNAIVSDECFPAGTLVDGTPIENIRVGDMVMSYDESSRTFSKQKVLRVFKNPEPKSMITIRSAGREFTCTANHPIYTDSGWRNAANVRSGDSIVYGVRLKGRHSGATRLAAQHIQENWTSLLFGPLPRFMGATIEFGTDDPNESEVLLGEDEGKQPDGSTRLQSEGESNPLGDGPQTARKGWKWYRSNEGSGDPRNGTWIRMEDGTGSDDVSGEVFWVSGGVQTGHCELGAEGRSGSGRQESLSAIETSAGQEEGFFPVWTGVDSVEVQERGDSGQSGDGFVYNLEVNYTHTYFANDFLVHNCHHSPSPQWTRVLAHFGLDNPGGDILSMGLTATPNRSDGIGLRKLFDEVIYNFGIGKDATSGAQGAIEAGFLVNLKCWAEATKTSLDNVHTVAGDFNQGELADAVNNPQRNATIVKLWAKHALDKKTVVFTVDIQHALDLAAAFKAMGCNAEAIWGDDPERQSKLARHRKGEIRVLCNCAVLTEGYDDAGIECIVLAKPTKSTLLLTQMVGRGTRLPDGRQHISEIQPGEKDHCVIIDVVDVTSKHNLASVPSLLGLPKNLNMKGETYTKAKEKIDRVAREFPTANIIDLKSLDHLDAISKQVELFTVKYPVEIASLTELAWRQQGDGYWLPVDHGRITLAQDLRGEWWARGMAAGKKIEIQAQNLAGAFNAVDRAITDTGNRALYARDARWRDSGPTPKQIALCDKVKLNIPAGATRGQVSAALDAHFSRRRA